MDAWSRFGGPFFLNPLRGWLEFLKRQQRAPEQSLGFRLAVTGLIVVALLAVCHQLLWPTYGFVAIALTLPGFWFSHRRRHLNNWWVKAILSVLMVVTLLNFFRNLATTLYDPRIPLAELLIWLQTLHSWDLPARKDLNYSMLVALILISMGAVLTSSMSYLGYLALFFAAGVVAIHFDHLSKVRQITGATLAIEPRPSLMTRQASRAFLPLLLLGAIAFALMPRYQSLRLRSLPVSWQKQFEMSRISQGQVVNPSYPNGLGQTNGPTANFSADNYHGFNTQVDLNMRGRLDDSIVMKVRSSHWTYYRGLVFDTYDGRYWSQTKIEPEELVTEQPPLHIPRSDSGRREKVQIFYVEKKLPNIIFSGLTPAQLYFPSTNVYALPATANKRLRDYSGGLISPFPLEEGTVYSVISYHTHLGPADIAKLPPRDPALRAYEQQYLQVPDSVSDRTIELAHQLTENDQSAWSKANRLAGFLQNTYPYRLDIPACPEGADAVDYFLFEERAGYCEQFATAMVMMGRMVGLKTRYVNGYLPGDYNPLTGFYEVKGSHAHAWVEVFIPNLGWLTFDPTPVGGLTPGLEEPQESRWLILSLARYLGIGRGPALALALMAASAGLGWLAWSWWGQPTPRDRSTGGQIRACYLEALKELSRAGITKKDGESVRNFLARQPGSRALRHLTELFEKAHYGPHQSSPQELEQARQALAELRTEVRKTGRQDSHS